MSIQDVLINDRSVLFTEGLSVHNLYRHCGFVAYRQEKVIRVNFEVGGVYR